MLILTLDVMRVPGAPGEAIFSAPGRREEEGNLYEVNLGPEWKLIEKNIINREIGKCKLGQRLRCLNRAQSTSRISTGQMGAQKLQTAGGSQHASPLQLGMASATKGFWPPRIRAVLRENPARALLEKAAAGHRSEPLATAQPAGGAHERLLRTGTAASSFPLRDDTSWFLLA